jgi:hypothetical protein
MIATVFLGPTMSLEDAREILPNALYRPPAAQGDLLAAVDQDHADLIGLIDGTFHHTLSVWHSEVCYLLDRGITVFGASSMGALRAAETEIYGTRGVGTIFGWYRDGVIMADDEVALLHGNEEAGYLPMSLPLVNIRASLAEPVSRGRLDPSHAEQVINVARSLYYPDRQVWTILQSCEDLLVPVDALSVIERALTEEYVDLKRADAREMLTLIKEVMDGSIPAPARVEFEFSRSSVFDTLYNLDRRVQIGDTEVSLQAIREHAALHDPRLGQVQRAALDRSIVVIFGTLLGLRVTQDELSRTRAEFLHERDIESDQALQGWLRANAMCEADLTEYLIGETLCTRLRNWMMNSRGLDRSCRAVLDEARAQGLFSAWAESAAEKQSLVTAYQDQPEYQQGLQKDFRRVAALHYENTQVPIRGDVRERAEKLGFDDVADLVEALGQSAIYFDVRARIERQLRALERAQQLLGDAPQ